MKNTKTTRHKNIEIMSREDPDAIVLPYPYQELAQLRRCQAARNGYSYPAHRPLFQRLFSGTPWPGKSCGKTRRIPLSSAFNWWRTPEGAPFWSFTEYLFNPDIPLDSVRELLGFKDTMEVLACLFLGMRKSYPHHCPSVRRFWSEVWEKRREGRAVLPANWVQLCRNYKRQHDMDPARAQSEMITRLSYPEPDPAQGTGEPAPSAPPVTQTAYNKGLNPLLALCSNYMNRLQERGSKSGKEWVVWKEWGTGETEIKKDTSCCKETRTRTIQEAVETIRRYILEAGKDMPYLADSHEEETAFVRGAETALQLINSMHLVEDAP